MEYTITQNDWNEIQRIRTLSRAHPSDISSMKNLYDKYINVRLKKFVDWGCPACVRVIKDELITFQSQSKIEVQNESKVDTSKQPSKSRKIDK
jgi:hypothetical protein